MSENGSRTHKTCKPMATSYGDITISLRIFCFLSGCKTHFAPLPPLKKELIGTPELRRVMTGLAPHRNAPRLDGSDRTGRPIQPIKRHL